jgi:hypothetical protein
MADLLRDAGLDETGRKVFGRSWPGARDAILAEVDLRRLHFELKAMLANHPITVDVSPGARGRVLITARLDSAAQVGSTKQTEFNVGAVRGRDRSAVDPSVATSKSQSASFSVQVLGNSDPTGLLAGVQAGANFVGVLGRNNYESQGTRVSAGMTTKAKAPGVVYEGTVSLDFRLESRPPLGAARVALNQNVPVYVRFLAEQEGPAPAAGEAAAKTPGELLRDGEVPLLPAASAEVPPRRVWSRARGQGLRDTDTVRGLPDTGGLLQALDIEGRALFGAQSWRGLAPVARGALAHPALMAGLPAMTRGEALLAPLAFQEIGHPEAEITATARIVWLRYRRTTDKAEMNPVNEVTVESPRSEQYWWEAGTQVQAGPVIGEVTLAGVFGGAFRSRTAMVANSAGRVLANAKIPADTAIYDAYVATKLTLRSGTRQRVVSGLIPAEIGIPVAETTTADPGVTEFRPPGELPETGRGVSSFRLPGPLAESAELALERWAVGLFGAGHGFGGEQLARVFELVEYLRRWGGPAVSTAVYLGWLGRAVGLHHQDPLLVRGVRSATGGVRARRRVFELLDTAAVVFDGERVTVGDLVDLRRLGDLATVEPGGRLRRRRPLTADSLARYLKAQYFREFARSGSPPLTAAGLRKLAERTREAKRVRRAAGGGVVRPADLRAQLTKWQGIGVADVLGLPEFRLPGLDWRTLNWRDLVGPDERARLRPPGAELDLGFAGNLAARIAGGFRRPGDGAELPAGVRVMLTVPANEVAALPVTSEVARLLKRRVLVQHEGQPNSAFGVCPPVP